VSDCPCRAIPAKGDPKGHVTANALGGVEVIVREDAPAPAKKRRAKKTLRGSHCVVSVKSGKVFNCTHSEEAAERLAERLGPRFRVKSRG
jgi:hypothetical protein